MTDIWQKDKRSDVMSRIRSRNTKPERLVRSILHRLGYRFRLHRQDLPGKPDIVLPKYHSVVLVHGCFWHFHKGCAEGRIPDTSSNWWKKKLQSTVERDKRNKQRLKSLGWKVLVIWECQVEKKPEEVAEQLVKFLGR